MVDVGQSNAPLYRTHYPNEIQIVFVLHTGFILAAMCRYVNVVHFASYVRSFYVPLRSGASTAVSGENTTGGGERFFLVTALAIVPATPHKQKDCAYSAPLLKSKLSKEGM